MPFNHAITPLVFFPAPAVNGSWWMAVSPEGFTQRAWGEADRMSRSRFGHANSLTTGPSDPTFFERKALRERAARGRVA